jgi:hypothetical protein
MGCSARRRRRRRRSTSGKVMRVADVHGNTFISLQYPGTLAGICEKNEEFVFFSSLRFVRFPSGRDRTVV